MGSKVLVLDADQRSALAVTRSLGRQGLQVTVADAGKTALAGCSRHCRQYLESPSSIDCPREYLDWIESLLSRQSFDLVLPVTEVTSQLLLAHQERFSNLNLALADYPTVLSLADKGKLVALAAEVGVPCPDSRWFASASELDLDTIAYPVVLKPCLSKIMTDDGWLTTRVRVLHGRQDLDAELAAAHYLHSYPFMLQAFIPGNGAGVFCLYDQGKPVAFFAHRRLREKPPEGGVSVLSESVPVDPKMQAYAERIMERVHWHGVAMVEFRVTPAGEPYLMEVNTRFWGSLQLAVDAGVDFPYWLWQIHRGEMPSFSGEYRLGQRLRWWLGDLDSLYIYFKGRYTLWQKLARALRFLTPRFRRCRHEVNRLGDMRPAWYELKRYLKDFQGG